MFTCKNLIFFLLYNKNKARTSKYPESSKIRSHRVTVIQQYRKWLYKKHIHNKKIGRFTLLRMANNEWYSKNSKYKSYRPNNNYIKQYKDIRSIKI